MSNDFTLQMEGIQKRFGGVHALKGVDFNVKRGEVHALVGENGAGKSTLIKILSGAQVADRGTIRINGEVVKIHTPSDAQAYKIGVIYQEFTLIPSLSVAENIFFGHYPKAKVKGTIPWKVLRKNAREALKKLGIDLNVEKPVRELSVAYQQMVEITKAITQEVDILILDEPTAVLSPTEVRKLFDVLETLKSHGVTMIYISHKLDEVFEIADTITVLKDGETMGTVNSKGIKKGELISMMIGRTLDSMFPKREAKIGEKLFEAEHITSATGNKPDDCSFFVNRGEVVGFCGLVGSGRTELMRCIFGADPIIRGKMTLNGKKIVNTSPRRAVKNKMGLVPEDRKAQAVILGMSVKVNTTMSNKKEFSRFGTIDSKKENSTVRDLMGKINIKALSPEVKVTTLSGGNQQKVALAKWFCTKTDLVIFDEPTRGVDVGAKYEIYKLVNLLAEQGKGVIIISSEMEEVIGLSDRVYVLREGKITGMLEKNELTEDAIMHFAI